MKSRYLFTIVVWISLVSSVLADIPVHRIATSVADSGRTRVAIFPIVISRRGDIESITGALGPRSPLMVHEVYKKLVTISHRGRYKNKFRVLPERTMRKAIMARRFTAKDIGDAVKMKNLGDHLGGDCLVISLTNDEAEERRIATVVDNGRPRYNVVIAKVIDTHNNLVVHSEKILDYLTLARAAYNGESWEVRRWKDDKLQNLAIDLDKNRAFGMSVRWEKWQYERLNNQLQHPRDIPDFPYSFDILVDGKIRQPQSIQGVHGKQYVVELNPGEVYKIRLNTKSDKSVHVALFIDGVNSIDRQRMEPEDLETWRHWYLKADSGVRDVAGWYLIDRNERQIPKGLSCYEEFTVPPNNESAIVGLGRDREKVGMITAIFYTEGMDGIDRPDGNGFRPGELPRAILPTGLGDRKDKQLQFPTDGRKPRGLMLAAVTYYYRTAEELESLKRGDCVSDLALVPRNKTKDEKEE